MKQLSALHIKALLVQALLNGQFRFNSERDCIGLEVPFSENKRLADLVLFRNHVHAFEIKGDFDNLTKLKSQLFDYHKVFEKVTLITTTKHIKRASISVPPKTGIILLNDTQIKVIRRPKLTQKLSKSSLLMFLNKMDIAKLLKCKANAISTDEIRRLAERMPLKIIKKAAYQKMRGRYSDLFKLFLRDKGTKIHLDDLRSLTGQINQKMLIF